MQGELDASGIVTEISLLPHFRDGLYWYPGEGGVDAQANSILLSEAWTHERWTIASSIEATISPGFNLRFAQQPELSLVSPTERDSLHVSFAIENAGQTGLASLAWRATRLQDSLVCQGTLTEFLSVGDLIEVRHLLEVDPDPGLQEWSFVLDPAQRVIETNEDDNSASLSYQVLTQAEPRLQSMQLSDTLLAPGDPVNVTLLVRNDGEEEIASLTYVLYAEDSQGHTNLVANGTLALPGSAEQSIELMYVAAGEPGMHHLRGELDPADALDWEYAADNLVAASLRTRQPGVSASWSAPATLPIGEVQDFRMRVTNTTEIPLGETSLQLDLPEHMELVGSTPAADAPKTWLFAELMGGVSETVILHLRAPEGLGLEGQVVTLGASVEASTAGGASTLVANANHVVELGEDTRPPLLDLDVSNTHISQLDILVELAANEALSEHPTLLLQQLADTLLLEEMEGAGSSWQATLTPDPGWTPGVCHLTVVAQDLRGNDASVERDLIVDHSPPALAGDIPEWINHDAFHVTITPDEALAENPQIVFSTEQDTFPTTLRRSGSGWRIDAQLPETSQAPWARMCIRAVDLAGNEGLRCDTLYTDFVAPEISHNLPLVTSPGMVEVLLQPSEELSSAPSFTAVDAAGRSLSKQGPYALGGSYKIFLLIPSNIASGVIQVNCSATDLAGNTGSFTPRHCLRCDWSRAKHVRGSRMADR